MQVEALRIVPVEPSERRKVMGMVIDFTPRSGREDEARRNDGIPAIIVIFPGVRYERRDQGSPAVPGGMKSGDTAGKAIR